MKVFKLLQFTHSQTLFFVILLNIIQFSYEAVYFCDTTTSCGCSKASISVGRIVGGETASPSSWGWAVSISINSASLCGGSILSNSWIITAAHCVSGRLASSIIIYAGSNIRWAGTQSRVVSKVFIHPKYNPRTYVNDIALLELKSPLDMSDPYVGTVCLPSVSQSTLSDGEWPPVGTTVSIPSHVECM